MDDLDSRLVGIDAPVAEVDDYLLRSPTDDLQQAGGLLELRRQDMGVVRVAGEAPGAHHQALHVRDRQAYWRRFKIEPSGSIFGRRQQDESKLM